MRSSPGTAPVVALLVGAALLTGCGDSGEESPSPPTVGPVEVDLAFSVRSGPSAGPKRADLVCPGGDRKTKSACRELARMDLRAFDPVPSNTPCPELYGGPETARVVGTIEAREIISEFSKVNGCEIARWQDLTPVMEELGIYEVGSGGPR